MGAGEAHLVGPLKLLDAYAHVVDVEHGDALETVWDGVEELGNPVVVGPADVGQEVAVLSAVEHDAGSRIDDADVHAVDIKVFDVFFGDEAAEAALFHPDGRR